MSEAFNRWWESEGNGLSDASSIKELAAIAWSNGKYVGELSRNTLQLRCRAEKAEARVKELESGLKSFLFDTANDAIGMSRYMGLGEIVHPDGLKDSKLKFERMNRGQRADD